MLELAFAAGIMLAAPAPPTCEAVEDMMICATTEAPAPESEPVAAPSDDPCFRQDPECYGPPPATAPEPPAPGRQLCPDGTYAIPVDAAGTLGCPGPALGGPGADPVTGQRPDLPPSPPAATVPFDWQRQLAVILHRLLPWLL